MTMVEGSHGNTPESSERQASPPSPVGTTSTVMAIIGTPPIAVTRAVRRADEGTSAARMAACMAMPANGTIDK